MERRAIQGQGASGGDELRTPISRDTLRSPKCKCFLVKSKLLLAEGLSPSWAPVLPSSHSFSGVSCNSYWLTVAEPDSAWLLVWSLTPGEFSEAVVCLLQAPSDKIGFCVEWAGGSSFSKARILITVILILGADVCQINSLIRKGYKSLIRFL